MSPSAPAGNAGVRSVAVLLGLVLLANGLFMLVAPMNWYLAVPGVTATGQFNQHFIRDIGIVYLFLGGALGGGLFRPHLRFGLWTATALWLTGHALFHVWEVASGLCGPAALVRDFPAISLPALLGLALSAWAWRQRPQSSPPARSVSSQPQPAG